MTENHVKISTHADLNPFERFLTLFTKIRSGEGLAVAIMFVHSFLIMGCYSMVKPLRDALILSEGSPEIRSYATAFQAGILMLFIPAYSWLFRRRGDSLMIQRINIFFVFNLALFAGLGLSGVRFGVVFFVWVGIFSVMLISQFWSFAADLFSVKAGQRLFAIIAVGMSLGAIAGPAITGFLFEPVGPYGIMLVASAILASTLLISSKAKLSVPEDSRANPATEVEEKPPSWIGGFHVVFRSHYLILIAAFVVLMNWMITNGDYILAKFLETAVVDALGANASNDQKALWNGEFFSNFYFWINSCAFFIQLFFVARIFRWVGIHMAILIFPLMLAGGFLIIGLIPLFAVAQIVLGAQKATDYSLMNTTRVALFLPTTKSQKNEGKTTIDTFFMRFGDLFSALTIFAFTVLGISLSGIIGLSVAQAFGLLALAWIIGRHYRRHASSDSFNLPPQVHRIIPDALWVGSGPFAHRIPADAFIDPDAGDVLEVNLTGVNMDLPAWLRFDVRTQTLHCDNPPTHETEVNVVAVAKDYDGLEATSNFMVKRKLI